MFDEHKNNTHHSPTSLVSFSFFFASACCQRILIVVLCLRRATSVAREADAHDASKGEQEKPPVVSPIGAGVASIQCSSVLSYTGSTSDLLSSPVLEGAAKEGGSETLLGAGGKGAMVEPPVTGLATSSAKESVEWSPTQTPVVLDGPMEPTKVTTKSGSS